MIKRLILLLAFVASMIAPVHAAGTINLSLTQQLDKATQKPLAGGKLYFFQAGTTTPQTAFQDSGLTIPLPGGSVYTLGADGRIPQFFLADGSIKVRLTNAAGVEQFVADGLLVIGPSGSGGGGSPVDATTILATGDVKSRYGTGVLTGFVRMNGRTIGSASSGATERANADTQSLFEYLWNNDPNLAVSTGRGASSNADWVANKNIVLPDARGRVLASLDDMGNSLSGRLTSTYLGSAPNVLGGGGGVQAATLAEPNVPAHKHSGTTAAESATHTHGSTVNIAGGLGPVSGSGTNNFVMATATGQANQSGTLATGTESATHNHAFTTDNGTGTSTPFGILPPMILVTNYIKL